MIKLIHHDIRNPMRLTLTDKIKLKHYINLKPYVNSFLQYSTNFQYNKMLCYSFKTIAI